MKLFRLALKEILIALGLLALGLFGLPALIYVVGQLVVGDYEAGLPAFYEAVGAGLIAGQRFAWLMILSPYLSIQIIRLWFRLRRPRPNAT